MNECPQCLAAWFGAQASCPYCGASAAPEAVEERGAAPGAAPSAEPAAAEEAVHFRRQFEERAVHVPERVLRRAEQILASAQSELRRATVLLADLRGFSRAARETPPEKLSRLAAEFYDACTGFILRRGGFVVKFLGDAVLAVFGAPVAFDRDTESAVLAALDIRDWARECSAGEPPIEVSIGLATGEIHSGRIEGPAGKTYDILGHAVNLATRLQEAAGRNEILACAETYEAARRRFRCEPTAPLSLKNADEDYLAYRVVDFLEAAPFRETRTGDTPFRGREKELAALADFLSQPPAAPARVAHVEGEAGMGKSRLVHEALRQRGAEARAVWWEASPSTASILLWPVLQWLRREIGLTAHDTPAVVREAIHRHLSGRLPEEDHDPLLLEYIFGVPQAIAALQGMPPERIQRNLFALLRRLLFAGGGRSGQSGRDEPPILVADDLQWADPLTIQFLRSLAEWPGIRQNGGESRTGAAAPLLSLVLVYRPELGPGVPPAAEAARSGVPIPPAADHLRIRLQALSETERRALLERLAPVEEFLPEVRQWVLSKASGNPLFLEEMTRLVRDVMRKNADLNGEALKNQIIQVIPATLRDLIQSRIDRLESRTRQVLQCASLLGIEFAFSLIELFDAIRDGLAGHLHGLCALRYLEEHPETSDIRFLFTHGLFRDVAYSTLLEEQRQRLHGALARRLEAAVADRIQEYCELLAFHYARGGESQKAIYYLVKAADRQAGLGAPNARENYAEAIELLRSLPPAPSRQALMARILVRCGRLNRSLGEGAQADEMLAGALQCARELGNERLALEARLEMAITEVERGQFEEAAAKLNALAREASRLGSPMAEIVALNSLGVIHFQGGRYEEALRAFQSLAALAERHGAPQVEADAFNNAGLIYWRWGQYAQALKAFRRALPLRRQAGDSFGLSATLMNLGIIQEQMGKIPSARSSYRNALRLAEKIGFAQGQAALESNLSNLERRVGTMASAMEHAARAIEFSAMAQDPVLESIAEQNAGLACAERNEADSAKAHFSRALEIARSHGVAEQEINTRLSLLELAAKQGPAGDGRLIEINDLLHRIEEQRFVDLVPRAYRVKARILDALDEANGATAREYLEMARDQARNAGSYLEELDSWRALRDLHERHGAEQETERCAAVIGEMEQTLNDER